MTESKKRVYEKLRDILRTFDQLYEDIERFPMGRTEFDNIRKGLNKLCVICVEDIYKIKLHGAYCVEEIKELLP